MKVCLLTRYFDLRNGGIGRFSVEICQGLRKRGFEIVRVATNTSGITGYFFYTGIEMPFRIPRGCDIYHSLTPLEAIYVPKERSVVTFYDLIPWLHLNKLDTHYASGKLKMCRRLISKHYFRLASQIAARCSAIACISEETKKEVIEHLDVDESKVKVVRLGVSADLKPEMKTDGVFRIGTLSYLDPRKRIGLLIQSFLAANVDGELVIGGEGIDYARLKALAGGDKRIKFLGFVPEERLAYFYNSLDLFVFPTKFEGYGLPIVEAFACNKPAVVLEDGLIPEEVKSRCTVVDNLIQFFQNPKHSCDVQANFQFARLHNWDSCVQGYIDLYERIQ